MAKKTRKVGKVKANLSGKRKTKAITRAGATAKGGFTLNFSPRKVQAIKIAAQEAGFNGTPKAFVTKHIEKIVGG